MDSVPGAAGTESLQFTDVMDKQIINSSGFTRNHYEAVKPADDLCVSVCVRVNRCPPRASDSFLKVVFPHFLRASEPICRPSGLAGPFPRVTGLITGLTGPQQRRPLIRVGMGGGEEEGTTPPSCRKSQTFGSGRGKTSANANDFNICVCGTAALPPPVPSARSLLFSIT